jgi:hypothetical protein
LIDDWVMAYNDPAITRIVKKSLHFETCSKKSPRRGSGEGEAN